MTEPLVEADRASRRYGQSEAPVVKEVSCGIFPGDRIVATGRSGSGKSSLLHLLAGLDVPTSGLVSWPALGPRQGLRPGKIGFAPQASSLFPALSIVENVTLPLTLLGQSDQSGDKARAILDRLGLLDLAEKLPQEISGGQAQRVAVARALVTEPALFIADEPTGQLDSATGARLIRLLNEIGDRTGMALLIATHDEAIAAGFEMRWQINDGRLTQNPGRASLAQTMA